MITKLRIMEVFAGLAMLVVLTGCEGATSTTTSVSTPTVAVAAQLPTTTIEVVHAPVVTATPFTQLIDRGSITFEASTSSTEWLIGYCHVPGIDSKLKYLVEVNVDPNGKTPDDGWRSLGIHTPLCPRSGDDRTRFDPGPIGLVKGHFYMVRITAYLLPPDSDDEKLALETDVVLVPFIYN